MMDSEKTAIIRSGLDHPFWRSWLLPAVQERARQMLEALAASKSSDEDIKRGWFQALRWLMNLPQSELDAMARAEQEAQTSDAEQQQDAYRAQFGNRSPYRMVPDPGVTKEQEPEPPTAQATGDSDAQTAAR